MVQEGDILHEIDGRPVPKGSIADVSALVIGAEGSEGDFVFLRGQDRVRVRIVRTPSTKAHGL